MSSQISFWRRMGSMFRGGGSGGNGTGNGHTVAALVEDVPAVAGLGARNSRTAQPEQAARGTPGASANGNGNGNGAGRLMWLGRRDPSVAQTREGYQRLLETMDALQVHFERQDERAAQVGDALERVHHTLEQLADVARHQQASVRTIAEQVGRAGDNAAVVSGALGRLPQTIQAEADTLRALVRQMELGQDADGQLMVSLQKLGLAVDTLNASGAAHVRALERLDESGREQRETLAVLVREQTRRFMIIIIVAAIIGLGALATLGTMLAVELSR